MALGKGVVLALLLGAEGARVTRHNSESTNSWRPKLLPGRIAVKRPAFLMLDEEKNRVVISQFGFASKGNTTGLPLPAASSIAEISLDTLKTQVSAGELSGSIDNNPLVVRTTEGLLWPNILSKTPAGYGDYLVVPDGFLPPGKRDGEVYLVDTAGSVAPITRSEPRVFYHEVEWHDFNGDGLLDILTARVKLTGRFSIKFSGEMVWLENPGKDKMYGTVWTEHSVTSGPDVVFKSVPYALLDGGLAVFATEFFNPNGPRLTVNFIDKNGVKESTRLIDDTIGKPFAVDIVDLDGDGVDELLVTNHQSNGEEPKPAVYAFEVPWANLKNGQYTRHTLCYGIAENVDDTSFVGAPGFAHGFYPRAGMTGPKWVFAAGDGSYDVWILKPKAGRFQYEAETIWIGGTTGQILEHDYDGDGILDLLIPDNDFWKLHVITFEQ
jgi:hypothetical protein